MTKRQKFVLSSGLLALGFFLVQLVATVISYPLLASLTLFSLLLATWSLQEGLGKDARLLTLILPSFFTAGVGLFYFLLPQTIFLRIPILLLYAVGIYALFLTANIYTVATARSIALLRAAHAVGFLLTLVTGFLLFDAVFSLRSNFAVNAVALSFVSFFLFLQGLWAVELERKISKEVWLLALGLALVVGEIAAVLSFWPITVAVASLAITTVVYVGLGLGQVKLQGRLFAKTIREYLLVGAIVSATMFLTARWGG